MSPVRIRASAIITRGNQILLMHRKKAGKEYWVLPGGGVEQGETAEAAVAREVKEETNLDVVQVKHAFNFASPYDNGHGIRILQDHPAFYCEVADGEVKLIGEEAYINCEEDWYNPEWVDISNVPSLTFYPEGMREKMNLAHEN